MKPDKIKAVRQRLGINTKEMGARLGVSGRTIEDWEQGRHKPSGPAMLLLKHLGASPPGKDAPSK